MQAKEWTGHARGAGHTYRFGSIKEVVDNENTTARIPFTRYSYVFNLSQTSLWDERRDSLFLSSSNPEKIWTSLKHRPILKHNISRCYYNQVDDYISLPLVTEFSSADEYYSSLFHEAVHWTGHPSRLNRQGDYAFEELVAEIGSSYLCGMSGIEQAVLDNQASYIMSWLKNISENPYAVIQAAREASKGVDYLIGTHQINSKCIPQSQES